MPSRCRCTSGSCDHHPTGGPCPNETIELPRQLKEGSEEATESECDYGLCAACWMTREGKY